MLYYLAFLLVVLTASVLLFRLVTFAAAEIARVFLFLFLVLFPVTVWGFRRS